MALVGRFAATWKRPWAREGEISAPTKQRGNFTGLLCIGRGLSAELDKDSILEGHGGQASLSSFSVVSVPTLVKWGWPTLP